MGIYYPRWTADEEAVVVRLAVSAICAGGGLTSATGRICRQLPHRTPKAVNNIIFGRLRPQIMAAASDLQAPAPVFRSGGRRHRSVDIARPHWWGEIEARLADLGNDGPWTPSADLMLIERMVRGEAHRTLATRLRVTVPAMLARFDAIWPPQSRGGGPARLIEVLSARAARRLPEARVAGGFAEAQ